MPWPCSFNLKHRKHLLYPVLSVSIGCSHSISGHSEKFNVCDFHASTQAFLAKTEIVCEHWCSYIYQKASRVAVLAGNTCMETRLQGAHACKTCAEKNRSDR